MALSENYFKSRDVRVFPSSFRGTYDNTTTFDPEARLNTEANFIAPKIAGNKASYIVNYNANKIKFVLGGYYFEINNLNNYKLSDKYLNIKLRDVKIAENQDDNKDSERKTYLLDTWYPNSDYILDVVDTEDNISYFSGLTISESPENGAYASIKLFDDEGNLNQEAILVDLDHGTGENTLMHGVGLTANTTNQTVFGTYNDNKADTLFEVGKGSSETNKNNALEISTTTTTINNDTNINGNTIITGITKIEGTAEITNNAEIKGELSISKDTESDSVTNGALKVTGGVGVGKNLNVGGDTNLNSKLIVKTSPTDTETNVKVDGTLNVTGKTDIYSNVTVDSDKTTLAKPVEITDTSDNALTVKGKTTIEKDLEVGTDTKVLTIKNSPNTGEQNVTVTGTLKSTDKVTFENGLEVASGKTTTLGGQVNITGAVNINTSNQTNPEDITIYGDTTINGDISITGDTHNIIGSVDITGKVTSTATVDTDGSTTLTTKDYVVSKITALNVASVGDDGKYLKTISESKGIIDATAQEFDKEINDSSTDKNAPTSKAVKDFVNDCIDKLDFPLTGGTETVKDPNTGKDVNAYSYIDSIKQENGRITSTKKSIATDLSSTFEDNSTIPSALAVQAYVNNATQDIADLKDDLKDKNLTVINDAENYTIKYYSNAELPKQSWTYIGHMGGFDIKAVSITGRLDYKNGGFDSRDPNMATNKDDADNAQFTLGYATNFYAYYTDKELYIANANAEFSAKVDIIVILKGGQN